MRIAPLAAKYGNSKAIALSPEVSKRRKGGVQSRRRQLLNTSLETWSVNVTVENGLEVRDFFRSLKTAERFQFNYDGTPHPEIQWICLDWSLTYPKGVYTFQGSFQQVYRHMPQT